VRAIRYRVPSSEAFLSVVSALSLFTVGGNLLPFNGAWIIRSAEMDLDTADDIVWLRFSGITGELIRFAQIHRV
jgi:hypothetical protein